MSVAGLSVALSVCADFGHPQHWAGAAELGAKVYAASVLIGEAGYLHDSSLLQACAHEHEIAVLMANHGGQTGGWAAAGRSAFWDERGQCVAATAGTGNSLLIVSKQLDGWQGFEASVPVSS